jgi:hypothetical protein
MAKRRRFFLPCEPRHPQQRLHANLFHLTIMIHSLEAPHRPSVVNPTDLATLARRQRRIRMARFVAAETFALGLTVASVIAGVSARFSDESLTPIFQVLPIVAAAAATILPIIFFGGLKRGRRW